MTVAPRSTRSAASRQPRYLTSLSDLRPEALRPRLAAGLPLHCEASLALNSTQWRVSASQRWQMKPLFGQHHVAWRIIIET